MKEILEEEYKKLLENTGKTNENYEINQLIEAFDILTSDTLSTFYPIAGKEDFREDKQIFYLSETKNQNDIEEAIGNIEIGLNSISANYINPDTNDYSYILLQKENDKSTHIEAHICDTNDQKSMDISDTGIQMPNKYYAFTSDDLLEKVSMAKMIQEMIEIDTASTIHH